MVEAFRQRQNATGVVFLHSPCRMRDITDGASNTYCSAAPLNRLRIAHVRLIGCNGLQSGSHILPAGNLNLLCAFSAELLETLAGSRL